MKRIFKLIPLFIPLFVVSCCSDGTINKVDNISPRILKATYGTDSPAGYVTGPEYEAFTPTRFKKGTGYGMYYTGTDDNMSGVIQSSIVDSSHIKFTAPFIVPVVHDDYLHHSGLWNEYKYVDPPYVNDESVWTDMDIYTKQLHLDKTGITVQGRVLGGSGLTNISFTASAPQGSGNVLAVQDLQLSFSVDLYNYEEIRINLGSVTYNTLVEIKNDGYGAYLPEWYDCDAPIPSSGVSFVYTPSSIGAITGTDITNLTDQAIWYEGPHESGTRRSYKNKSTLVEYLKNTLINNIIISLYNNITYSSETHFTFASSQTYVNSLGSDQVFTSVDPYQESLFTHGGTYDIWVAPIFASSTLDSELTHNITKLVAIPKDSTALLHEIVDAQVEKLVKECSVFDDVHPGEPYSSSESVLFNDYSFKRDATVTNSKVATYKHYSPSGSGVESYTATAGETVNFNSPQSLYTFQYKNINGSYTEYKNIFSANALSSSQWLNQAVASGATGFTNIWNSFFSSGLNANQYVTNSEETSNIVTFKSKDKLFIRVTKDDEDPVILTASTTYGLSTTGYSTLESSNNDSYDFSNPGEYVIELINRSDNSKLTKYLSIYDESEIYLSHSANNAELGMNINIPSGTSLLNLSIYHSSTKTAYPSSQSKVVEIEPLNPSEIVSNDFLLQSKDADDTTIGTGTRSYKFTQKGCYYVLVQVLNETKAFYVYYNYIPPEPDEIHINITDQVLDVGDSINYEITYSCTSGEEPVTKLNYNYEASNDRVTVDRTNNKIIATKPGVVSVTFTLENELDYVTVNFTVKEPPAPPEPTPTPEPSPSDSSEVPSGDPSSSETSSSESTSSSEDQSSSSSEVTPEPEEKKNNNTVIVVIIVAAVGSVAVATLIFVIIRARKIGRMKK